MYTTPSISSAHFKSVIASQRRMNSSRDKRSPLRNGGGGMWAAIDIESVFRRSVSAYHSLPQLTLRSSNCGGTDDRAVPPVSSRRHTLRRYHPSLQSCRRLALHARRQPRLCPT